MFSRPILEVGVIVQIATLAPQPSLNLKGLKTEGAEDEQPPRPTPTLPAREGVGTVP